MTEPGAANTPRDDDGRGPVGLPDRTTHEQGAQAPASNQGKAEPMPPGPASGAPGQDAPSPDETTVGSADPQAPTPG